MKENRKLLQETRDPACKTKVHRVTRSGRRIFRKRGLENGKKRWKTAKSRHKKYGLLQNPSQKRASESHLLQFMVP
jgi:hypothetical protein